MTDRGVCWNAECENARSATAVELYPGPGQYCPECGEELEALSLLETLAKFSARTPPSPQPPKPEPRRKRKLGRTNVVISAIALTIGIAAVANIASVAFNLHAAQAPIAPRTISQAERGTRTKTRAELHRRAQATPRAESTAVAAASPSPAPTPQPTTRPGPSPHPNVRSAFKGAHSRATPARTAPIAGSRRDADPRLAAQLANAAANGFQTLAPALPSRIDTSRAATPTTSQPANGAADTPASPSATPTPASCTRPDTPATVVRGAIPETPTMAQQQAITGTVQVLVSLNAQSRVVRTRVQSSPSAVLNFAALTAARNSQFRTQIKNCEPIAADYVFNVTFQ